MSFFELGNHNIQFSLELRDVNICLTQCEHWCERMKKEYVTLSSLGSI